jgi:hypothetical protein
MVIRLPNEYTLASGMKPANNAFHHDPPLFLVETTCAALPESSNSIRRMFHSVAASAQFEQDTAFESLDNLVYRGCRPKHLPCRWMHILSRSIAETLTAAHF